MPSPNHESVEKVVSAAMQSLEQEGYETKVAALRSAIDEGDASGDAEGNVFARVREKLKLSAPR